ncbi:MAG: DUF1573 domain-containing protein [Blastocatellia bacterium]
MKLKHTLSLFAVWLALATVAFAQAATGAPKIVIKHTDHNLGEVKKGVSASYTFVFKNEGTADLEIKRVAPS